jgi:hypothetical protein
VYGPAFVAFAAFAVALGGGKVGASLWIVRVATCLAFLGGIALLNAALAGSPKRRLAVAAFGLNPVALWSAAEGHNDVLVLLTVFAGLAWLRRGRAALGGFTLALSLLVKAIGFVAGPVTLAYLWLRRDVRTRSFGAFLLLGTLLALALLLPTQLKALGTLGAHGRYAPQFSLQAMIGTIPGLILAGGVAVIGVRDLARNRFGGIVWLGIAGWLAIPNPYPWYALWVLPVAVAAPASRASFALWAATISILLRYLPEAFGNIDTLQAFGLGLAQLAPLAWSATQVIGAAPQKATPHA